MSSTIEAIKGKIIIHAFLDIKPEHVAAYEPMLSKLRAHANSDAEPGCIVFLASRFWNKFSFYEEFINAEAFALHAESEPYQALLKYAAVFFAGPPTIHFFEDFLGK